MRKHWLFVPGLAVILAAGFLAGGVALAQDNGTNGGSPMSSIVSRVAQILGIEEARVQDAFDKAVKEKKDEAIQSRLDYLVEQGRLTQEQADEYKQWYKSKPEGLDRFGGRGFGHGKGFGRGWGGMRHWGPPKAQSTDAT